jgi:hypothetical protein
VRDRPHFNSEEMPTSGITNNPRVILQCVHWGRLKSFCLFHQPGRSVEALDGGTILMALGLLINIYNIVEQIIFIFPPFAVSKISKF